MTINMYFFFKTNKYVLIKSDMTISKYIEKLI